MGKIKMKKALFVARLQPLHKGHVYAIKNALKKYDKLVIAIGSINKRGKDDPFSFALRKKMLEAALSRYRNRFKIIGVPDFRSDARWTGVVERRAKFDLVISSSAWVKKCFPDFPVKNPKMLKRKEYNATHIRKLMKGGKKWQHLVPKEVAKMIMKSGVGR